MTDRELQQHVDAKITQAVLSTLEGNTLVPDDRLSVSVSGGWVTLHGSVNWEYQRTAAATAVRDLTGVRGVTNSIAVEPHVSAMDIASKIEAA